MNTDLKEVIELGIVLAFLAVMYWLMSRGEN